MCAHLAEVETKEESEWLAATFLMKGKLSKKFIKLKLYQGNFMLQSLSGRFKCLKNYEVFILIF